MMECGCKGTCKGHKGELLQVRITSDCVKCKTVFQINKEPGVVDYKCPKCGLDNYLRQ